MIGDMALLGDSVWISVRPSSTILCYRAQKYDIFIVSFPERQTNSTYCRFQFRIDSQGQSFGTSGQNAVRMQ